SGRPTKTFGSSTRSGWSTASSRRPDVSFRELLEKGQIAEFPALQLALGSIKGRIERLTVASLQPGGSREEFPLVEILGAPSGFHLKVLESSPDYLDWLNSALLCAGFVEPIGLTATARRLAEYEDLILGVDTNILYASILGEHLLDEFSRIHVRPYKESINWILLVIPGVVMKELENAANMRKGGRLSHAAEGLSALRIQYPSRLRKGHELTMPKEESVLLARVVYELAVEFGTVRVGWEDHGPHHIDLEGSWTWKSMEHWEAWQLLTADVD